MPNPRRAEAAPWVRTTGGPKPRCKDGSVASLGRHQQLLASQGHTYWRRESNMAKSKKKAESVFLVCEDCGGYNYVLRRKPGGEKLKLKKYCNSDRRHTVHNEKKK